MIALTEIAFLMFFLLIAYWRDEKLIYIAAGMALMIFGFGFFASSVYFGMAICIVGGATTYRGIRLKKVATK